MKAKDKTFQHPEHWREWLQYRHDKGELSHYAWHLGSIAGRMWKAATARNAGAAASETDSEDNEKLNMVFLAAALVAHHTTVDKHVCLDLETQTDAADILGIEDETVRAPLPRALHETLKSTPCLFAVADATEPALPLPRTAPFIIEGKRLYLQRYFVLEKALATILKNRAEPLKNTCDEPPFRFAGCPEPKTLTRLRLDPEQRAAIRAITSETNRFCVITGAPGTGKTTIVGVALARLLTENPTLEIRLCAPTGKAAARLLDAVRSEIKNLKINEAIAQRLNTLECSTIHRLLGNSPSQDKFSHNRKNPFTGDVLVVDEVSMVDLPLLVALLDATPASCRVVLLGDKDQLAAVETGSVLTDICAAWKNKKDCLATLATSHRFPPGSGVDTLKNAINSGDAEGAWEILIKNHDRAPATQANENDGANENSLSLAPPPANRAEMRRRLHEYIAKIQFSYLGCETPPKMLARFEDFRILCATRQGACGVEAVNQIMLEVLGIKKNGHGYPILITENDYTHGLFNGDTGMCLRSTTDNNEIRVFFPDGKKLPIEQLPSHEPVFAMTVHKSQGSGFGRVLLILPRTPNRILTRELLYTGLTRARQHCDFWASQSIFTGAVQKHIHRGSGLKEELESTTKSIAKEMQS